MKLTKFVTTLQAVTQEYWDANQRPLLLSNLPVFFAERQIDHRAELNGETLKAFVIRTSGDNTYKVVTHPVHRAKIGLVPPQVDYKFEVVAEPEQEAAPSEMPTIQNDAIALLNILSKLDAEDLEKINIPVSVLAKLFKQS